MSLYRVLDDAKHTIYIGYSQDEAKSACARAKKAKVIPTLLIGKGVVADTILNLAGLVPDDIRIRELCDILGVTEGEIDGLVSTCDTVCIEEGVFTPIGAE